MASVLYFAAQSVCPMLYIIDYSLQGSVCRGEAKGQSTNSYALVCTEDRSLGQYEGCVYSCRR